MSKMTLGTNITGEIKGNILTLEVDLSKEHGATNGGNVRIASTGANVTLPGGQKLGLNVFRKVAK